MRRNNAVTVRLSDREMEFLDEISEERGLSMSETIRELLREKWIASLRTKVTSNE